MSAKHTPGPWEYEGANAGGRVLAMDDRQTIVHQPPCNPFNEQVVADAHLIAAAPELLAAARETVSAMTDRFSLMGADDDYIYDELGSVLAAAFFSARAAIAKATGGQP